jgi:GDP-4-dehydro-6-deoxy-D-mannose reductase
MRILITGVSGFIGSHLSEFLLRKNIEVHGTYFKEEELVNIKEFKDRIDLHLLDVRDEEKVKQLIKDTEPEVIYHLAAQSFPTVSWEKPKETLETNVLGTTYIFEAVKYLGLDSKILVACSSAEYGFVTEDEVPVKEDHRLLPLHPYGVSKVAQDLLAYQYYKNFGMKSLRVRIFNTTGPRKTNDVCSDFTKQIAAIEKGLMENRMSVGNLEGRRDITDVRDMVNAFWLVCEKGKLGEVYNICSSRAHKIQHLLDIMLKLSTVSINVFQDPKKMRPSDEPIIMGDNAKIRSDCGWEPKIPIEETIRNMLDYWRNTL